MLALLMSIRLAAVPDPNAPEGLVGMYIMARPWSGACILVHTLDVKHDAQAHAATSTLVSANIVFTQDF